MPTQFQPINTVPSGQPLGTDFVTLHDAAGTCKNVQLTDLQEVITPPHLWKDLIFNDVQIAYANSENNYLRIAPITTASSHQNDLIGFFLPQYGKIVAPEVVQLPWGDNTHRCTDVNNYNVYYNTFVSGKEMTQDAYTHVGNQGTNCAIGYANNYATHNAVGKGLGAGRWYIAHPSEWMMMLFPVFYKLKYAASLFGFTWPDTFWTSVDGSADKANRFTITQGNILGTNKTSSYGVLLLADAVIGIQTIS